MVVATVCISLNCYSNLVIKGNSVLYKVFNILFVWASIKLIVCIYLERISFLCYAGLFSVSNTKRDTSESGESVFGWYLVIIICAYGQWVWRTVVTEVFEVNVEPRACIHAIPADQPWTHHHRKQKQKDILWCWWWFMVKAAKTTLLFFLLLLYSWLGI